MGLQNSEGLVSLDTRVGIPLGNQKKKKKGPNLNILVCEIYESLHQEGELTWSLSSLP